MRPFSRNESSWPSRRRRPQIARSSAHVNAARPRAGRKKRDFNRQPRDPAAAAEPGIAQRVDSRLRRSARELRGRGAARTKYSRVELQHRVPIHRTGDDNALQLLRAGVNDFLESVRSRTTSSISEPISQSVPSSHS